MMLCDPIVSGREVSTEKAATAISLWMAEV